MSNLRPKPVPYEELPDDCPYYLMDAGDQSNLLFYPYPTLEEAMEHLWDDLKNVSINHIAQPDDVRLMLTVSLRGHFHKQTDSLWNSDRALFAVCGRVDKAAPAQQGLFVVTVHPAAPAQKDFLFAA